jgi:hypothetical protein
MTAIDFLSPGILQIKHQIRGILDSYSHDWDLIAELCQNAIDAIKARNHGRGHVVISIDATNAIIKVSDNGIGIENERLPSLMGPFSTSKSNDSSLVGEKGVGITFVIFSSDDFKISSRHMNADMAYLYSVNGARTWCQSDSNDQLMLTYRGNKFCEIGTEVEVVLKKDHPIFQLSMKELEFVLRTKTAVGDTGHIWGEPLDADCRVVRLGHDGKQDDIEFECAFLLPLSHLQKQEFVELDEYKLWRSEGDRSDADKRRRLHNKIVYYAGKKYQSGRQLRFWSCFVPQRAVWERMSDNFGLPRDMSESETGIELEVGFGSGLNTSTKGMPTGITLELKPKGSAGYVPNFFMIIEDPSLSFDIGRKAIQGRQQAMLREIAHDQFKEYINHVRKYMGGGLEETPKQWERDEVFSDIDAIPELGSGSSSFLKRPNGQEATVAGMFFDAMGRGLIKDIRPLVSGYKGRYDLYAKWGRKNVVIEFKYELSGLMKDFSDERKLFDEVDCVVLWEITEADRLLAKKRGIEVANTGSYFPHATASLSIPNVSALYVIELKSILLHN